MVVFFLPLIVCAVVKPNSELWLTLPFIMLCFLFRFFVFFCFLGPHLRHIEVPRLGVELEPQLLAYVTATVMPDLSRVCYLHHSSQQCQNPQPSEGGQGSNLHPHGYYLDSFLLCHNRNSLSCCVFNTFYHS